MDIGEINKNTVIEISKTNLTIHHYLTKYTLDGRINWDMALMAATIHLARQNQKLEDALVLAEKNKAPQWVLEKLREEQE